MCETKSFNLWLLQIVFLLGLLALLLWVSLRTKTPTYTIVDFKVPVLTVQNGNGSQNSNVIFSIEIENPNKSYDIYYNNINVTLYYGGDTIGGTTISSFKQGKGKTHHFPESVDPDRRFWNAALRAISNGTAQLRVGLVTSIKYQMWGRKSKHHGMNLQGHVPIGKDGKISGKKKKIKLRKISKKWGLWL